MKLNAKLAESEPSAPAPAPEPAAEPIKAPAPVVVPVPVPAPVPEPAPEPTPVPRKQPIAVGLFECEAERDDELTFDAGNRIIILEMREDGWWRGQIEGTTQIGLFPSNFVQLLEE